MWLGGVTSPVHLPRRHDARRGGGPVRGQSEASPTSSGFSNNLGRLRSLGLVDYPESGTVAATPLLFPVGLT